MCSCVPFLVGVLHYCMYQCRKHVLVASMYSGPLYLHRESFSHAGAERGGGGSAKCDTSQTKGGHHFVVNGTFEYRLLWTDLKELVVRFVPPLSRPMRQRAADSAVITSPCQCARCCTLLTQQNGEGQSFPSGPVWGDPPPPPQETLRKICPIT